MIELLAVFAVYRLATDFAWEDGPAGVYARARGWVLTRYRADDWRSEGVCCPICIGWWISLIAAIALWFVGDISSIGGILLWWWAIAGVTAFLARLTA